MNRSVLLGCAALISSAACADTYYFKGTSDYLPWFDPASWSLTGVDGEAASQVPGESDRLYGLQNRWIDLGGEAASIDGLKSTEKDNGGVSWDIHQTHLRNGALAIKGKYNTHSDEWYLDETATLTLDETSTYVASNDHATPDRFVVNNGCVLNILGAYWNYNTRITVAEGGRCTLNPTAYGLHNATGQKSVYTNQGQMDFPNGLVWQTGSGSSGAAVVLNQEAGTLILGGPLSKGGLQGRFTVNLTGGSMKVTGDTFFVLDEIAVTVPQFEFDVDEGKTLNMGAMTYVMDSVITKNGAGRMVLGVNIPAAIRHMGGVIAIQEENVTLNISESASEDCVVEIGAKGFTYADNAVSSVRFKVAPSVFEVGDVVLTCANEAVLAKASQDFAAAGITTTIEGFSLKIAPSELVFNSKTVTDLNEASGWKLGVVPSDGMSVIVSGDGVVADITGTIPRFDEITVEDGATLRVSTTTELPSVKLGARSTLEIVADVTASFRGLSFMPISDVSEMVSLRIPPSSALKVPGGTMFKNCSLDIKGVLLGTTDGPFAFGTAAADETAYFAMTAEGATVTALNTINNENASRLAFACPEVGGTVVVTTPIVFKDSTFTYNKKDGFAFGLNNPSTQAFQVIANNTSLEFGADTYIAGGANLVMTNGSVLLRKRHSEGDTADSNYNLIIQNRGKLTLVDRGELRTGITRVNRNLTDGVVRLNPDEVGWIGLEVLEGGIGSWYKLNGLDKGALRVANGTIECFTTYWWGWGNREHAFNKLVAVDIPAESTMIYSGVSPKMSTNNSTLTGTVFEAPFTGDGDLLIRNVRAGHTFEPTLARNDNTCTGRLAVGADEETAKARLHIADGANWAGTVVLDGRTDLVPIDQDHKNAKLTPATVALAGVELNEPYMFRVWITKEGDIVSITNDIINVGIGGWTIGANGSLGFESQNAIVFADLPPLTEFVLGRMPKGGIVPPSANNLLEVMEKEVEGDETESLLVARIKSYEFIFTGTNGSTDLNDAAAWLCESVPVGQDITIKGDGVTALLNAEQGLPSFSSIALREGATLKIVGKDANEADFVLPSLLCDATSSILIGDEAETATTVSFANAPVTSASCAEDGSVALTTLVVEKGATLVVPPGMKFKNVDLKLYGTISKGTTAGEGVYFGYAENGETSYFAMTSDGGCFDVHSNQQELNGRKFFLSPVEGGCVKAVGDIVLKNTLFKVLGGWMDFGEIRVGINNPIDETFNFILDGTAFETTATASFGGAAQIILKNGSHFDRQYDCRNHGYDAVLQDAATIAVEGEGAYLDFNVGGGYLRLNGTSEEEVVLRDGGAYHCRFSSGTAKGTLVVSNGYVKAGKSYYGDKADHHFTDVLRGFGAVRVEPDSALGIVADNSGRGEVWFERSMKFADIPFTGSGNVFVRNDIADQKSFVVTLVNGSSTCTGAIGVVDVVTELETETALEFADGANWAGTVLADENVRLARSSEMDTPVSVTFGTLNIADGKTFTINGGDKINLTTGTAGGGTMNILTDADIDNRTRIALGTAPAGAWTGVGLRINGKRGEVVETPIEGSSLVTCEGRLASGMMIILR